MASSDLSEKKWFESVSSPDAGVFEQLVFKYEGTVFSLALDLVGNEALAQEVLEEVFLRVYDELSELLGLCVDSAIHRFTYDIALAKLLKQIEDRSEAVTLFSAEVIESPPLLQ